MSALLTVADHDALCVQLDSALDRIAVSLVRGASVIRRRERGVSGELYALLTSQSWRDALEYDQRHGLRIKDAWTVLVGIESHCPVHLTPYDGDDERGRHCRECAA